MRVVTIAVLLVGLFFVVRQTTLAQETSINLKNGSMEQTQDGLPDDWTFFGGPDGSAKLSTSDQALVGKHCALVDASRSSSTPNSFANLSQSFDVVDLRGKTVRFRAAVRVTERKQDGRAQMWFRIDGPAQNGRPNIVAFDNMGDRPIESTDWDYYEITSKIPDDAERLIAGVLVFPESKTWIDDVTLQLIETTETPTTAEQFSRQSGMSNVDTRQSFFNHWLWLVALTVTLFVISQWGRFGGTVNLQCELVDYGWMRKFALRFSCCYWLLYCLPSPFMSLVFSWRMDVYQWHQNIVTKIVNLTGSNLLGIERELGNTLGGSGDKTFDYVWLLACFIISMLLASIWSLADRRKTDYRWVNDLLRSFLRYVLAFAMLSYGLAKIGQVMGQFMPIEVMALQQTWGDTSPMGVVWNMMGSSMAYTNFAGIGEVLGGLLLVWRRTSLLGAFVTIGVMANVVMLNFCYDIPVKQYSSHLFMMAIFIVLPDIQRLANFLFWNRPTVSIQLEPPYTNGKTIWLQRAIKTYLIVVGIGMPVYQKVMAEIEYVRSDELAAPGWFGHYDVVDFELTGEIEGFVNENPLASFTLRRFPGSSADSKPTNAIQYTLQNGMAKGDTFALSDSDQSFLLHTLHDLRISYQIEDALLISIEGRSHSGTFKATLKPLRREDFMLVKRGFRWINEAPNNQ